MNEGRQGMHFYDVLVMCLRVCVCRCLVLYGVRVVRLGSLQRVVWGGDARAAPHVEDSGAARPVHRTAGASGEVHDARVP